MEYNQHMDIILTYLAAISIIAVIAAVYDKQAAKKQRSRVPERTLMLIALLGGSVAMFVCMKLVRHKTKHKKFMLGLPLMAVGQAVLVWWVIGRL